MASAPEGTVVDMPDGTSQIKRGGRWVPLAGGGSPPGQGGYSRSNLQGGLELAAATGSGALLEPIAGLWGMANAMNPFAKEGAGARAIESVRGLAYQPSPHGQDLAKDIGSRLSGLMGAAKQAGAEYATGGRNYITGPLGLLANAAEQAMADTSASPDWYAENLGPAAGAAAKTIPAAIGGVLSYQGAQSIPRSIAARTPVQSASKHAEDIRRAARGYVPPGGNKEIASFVPNLAGKEIVDRVAKTAIKSGVDDGVVAAIKAASPVDKRKMLAMLNIKRKGLKNARFASLNRPADTVGKTLTGRYRIVYVANRRAASRLDGVAKSLRGQSVDISSASDDLVRALDDMGIDTSQMSSWGGLSGEDLASVFRGSDIEGIGPAQRLIVKSADRLSRLGQKPDAYDVHRLKRFIDEHVSFGKTAEGLTGKTEVVLKKLRRNLDGALDDSFPEYNAVNTQYAETRGVIDDLQSIAGKRMDLGGENADKALGTLLRRTLSNAQSRVPLMDSVTALEDVAKRYAMVEPGEDIVTQLLFADELDRLFGSSARTSFMGQIEQAGGNIVRDIVRGESVRGAVTQGVMRAATAPKAADNAKRLAAIEALLRK